jgi:hypothetical protein
MPYATAAETGVTFEGIAYLIRLATTRAALRFIQQATLAQLPIWISGYACERREPSV